MPAYGAVYQRPTEWAFIGWQKTVDELVKEYGRLRTLLVTLFMGYAGVVTQPERPGSYYYRFCETLAKLGLRSCYVHTVTHFPWHADGEYYAIHNNSITNSLRNRALNMQAVLEKVVMGEEYSTDHDLLKARGIFELEWITLADEEAFERTFWG